MTGMNFVVAITLLSASIPAAAAVCTAQSPAHRIPLLELYTSEGCDSCPPADRWFSSLLRRGLAPQQVVALAFHVDYWNYLGWTDPYSSALHSERQRDAARRNRARLVYTPQFLLDGADYRRSGQNDDLAGRLAAIHHDRAAAKINIEAAPAGDNLKVNASIVPAGTPARGAVLAYVAVYENNRVGDIAGGENRGKRLRHDAVVRRLIGPLPAGTGGALQFAGELRREHGWNSGDLHLAVFAQDAATGRTLQALAMPWCKPRATATTPLPAA